MAAEPAEEREIKELFHVDAKTFGIRAEALRESRGIIQAELAVLAGIKRSAISEIENGKRNIKLDTITKYAYGLKVHIVDLVAKTGLLYPKFNPGENTPVPFKTLPKEVQKQILLDARIAFGIRTKNIRDARNISQDRLDVLCGIPKGDISKIENGKKNIEFYRMVRLEYGLKAPLEDFFIETLQPYDHFPTLENTAVRQEGFKKAKKTVKKKASVAKKAAPVERPTQKANIVGNKKSASTKKAVPKKKPSLPGKKPVKKPAAKSTKNE